MIELAESQIKLDQFEDALATLKSCSRSAAALTLEANCYTSLGRFDEAQDRLRDSPNLDARYCPAKLAQGKLLLDRGQAEDAERVLAEAIQIEPQNRQVHFQLSQALRAVGKADEADAELRRMLEIQTLERSFFRRSSDGDHFADNSKIVFGPDRNWLIAGIFGK